MRTLTIALAVVCALLAGPPAAAEQSADTRLRFDTTASNTIVGLYALRTERQPSGRYVPVAGFVSLEAKPPGKRWRTIPGSRVLASSKGIAVWYYKRPKTPLLIRAVTLDQADHRTYSASVRVRPRA